MTINNAMTFIKLGRADAALRLNLLKADGNEALEAELAKENLIFSHAEFEEAYSLLLFKCQTQESAESLMEFRMWWNLLIMSYDKRPE